VSSVVIDAKQSEGTQEAHKIEGAWKRNMEPTTFSPWGADWLWSLPLIAETVVIHAFGLGVIDRRVTIVMKSYERNRARKWVPASLMGGTALSVTILHAFEVAIWAASYILLGALPDRKTAMLYSLNAMTTYGQSKIALELRWQLMGSLEALNGWILFGLTTAFLFAAIQRIQSHESRHF
jgi:hypothetical protein